MELWLAIIAVVGTLTGTGVGAWLGSRNERRQWLRTERLRVYTEFLGVIHALIYGEADINAVSRASNGLLLLGPESVARAHVQFVQAAQAWATVTEVETPEARHLVDAYLDQETQFLAVCSLALNATPTRTAGFFTEIYPRPDRET